MGILDKWLDDLPQQFQGKKHIEDLISVFAKQMEDLHRVFKQLDAETDLESAVGANLDMVGDIVTLTRKEAGVLAGIDVEDPVISDERYRQFLKYQMLVNTNECTYRDLMDGLALLWDVSPIYYREDPALPAVIILTMPFLTPGGKVVTLGEVPMVKPAGVRIEFEYYIKAIVEIAFNFWISSYDVPRCNTIVCGTHPRRATLGTIIEIRCEQDVRKAPCILDKYVDHVEHAGTFTVTGISADEKWYQLKSGLYITTIPEYVSFKATPAQKQQTAGTGYYRVRKAWSDAGSQIGAFKNQNNAIELCKQNSGYKVFDNDGNEIYPCIKDDGAPFKFRVTIPDLRIRKGPGTTYDYWKKNGSAEHTGENVFTIVDTSEGPGAKMWGLLKSGEKDRNRWISLDEDYGNRL